MLYNQAKSYTKTYIFLILEKLDISWMLYNKTMSYPKTYIWIWTLFNNYLFNNSQNIKNLYIVFCNKTSYMFVKGYGFLSEKKAC